MPIVRPAHAVFRSSAPVCNAWARRTIVSHLCRRLCHRLCPPYGAVHYVKSKENRPLFRLWARGSPLRPLFRLPRKSRGMARRQGAVPGLLRARCPDYSGRWVHLRAPAPCGAPTRHLGLYAFDRGRTGPAPSGRRGCPSTARGQRLRESFARRCRSRSPPYRTPPVDAPRRVKRDGRNITTLKVKSSTIFTVGVLLDGE